jgi:hypothetical protein
MWQSHLISHRFPVPVSRSLQVSLLASQPTESAAAGEPCGEPAISHDSHHVSLVQWTYLFASRHKGHRFKSPGGYLCGTGILLLALSRYKYTIITCTWDIIQIRNGIVYMSWANDGMLSRHGQRHGNRHFAPRLTLQLTAILPGKKWVPNGQNLEIVDTCLHPWGRTQRPRS